MHDPDVHDPNSLCDLGIALNNAGRHAEAADALRKALELRPDFTDARFNLGTAYAALGRTDEALACFRAVLERAPRSADTHSNIGAVLQERGELDVAMAAYERALEIRPDLVEALNNLGALLEDRGRRRDAMTLYRRALGSARAAYNLGLAHLREFEFEPGWRYCEARFHTAPPVTPPRRFAFPELSASDLGGGHTIAVWPEQGVGDQVLYSTLLPELEARGERFALEADPRLVAAYRRTHPRWEVSAPGQFAGCDRHIAIGSLPRLLRPDQASFARQPRSVLTADPGRAPRLSKETRVIGISWRSFQPSLRSAQRRRKSAPLAMFLPLARLPGVQLLDLQYGDTAQERAAFAAAGGNLMHLDELDLFSDLEGVLGAIAACDLVVTTSNVTAHFAGALGKETLLVYPGAESPFYYWVPGPDGRSLWYPSVRIVTGPQLDTWEKVMERVSFVTQAK